MIQRLGGAAQPICAVKIIFYFFLKKVEIPTFFSFAVSGCEAHSGLSENKLKYFSCLIKYLCIIAS
jgi:hypothetical protein